MSAPDNSNRRAPRRGSRRPTHIATLRQGIHQLFNGQSEVGVAPTSRPHPRPRPQSPDSPKTPRLMLDTFSQSRFDLPHIQRGSTTPPSVSPTYVSPTMANISHPPPVEHSPANYRPISPDTFHALQASTSIPPPPPTRQNTAERLRQFSGADREELVLVEAISRRDPRQKKKKPRRQKKPKAYAQSRRSCFPGVKNPIVRRKAMHYLGLALSTHYISQEFHVLLILIILGLTIFFIHTFITLVLFLLKPPPAHGFIPDMESMHVSPLGYATPAVPIRVTLGRDEEALIESRSTPSVTNAKAVASPPPAYGLWRESVRVDPDRLFWARNAAAPRRESHDQIREEGEAPRRPPSYVSDDGVEYVVEAAGRNIAPTTDVPLPVHPIGQNVPKVVEGAAIVLEASEARLCGYVSQNAIHGVLSGLEIVYDDRDRFMWIRRMNEGILKPVHPLFGLTEPSSKEDKESTKAAGHFSIDSTTYYTTTLPPKAYLHHSPVHSPLSKPSTLCPSNVSLPPHHIPWPPPYGSLLPLLPLVSGDQFGSKPLDQIVPISSKGIYQVPGFCCKVVKKEMDNGNEKRDKARESKNKVKKKADVKSSQVVMSGHRNHSWSSLYLGDWRNTGDNWVAINIHSHWDSLGLRAVARDMAGLATLVTGLACSVERTAVWCGAVTADVAELAAGETLQCLSLAVSGKVVALTALVAGGWARALEGSSAWGKSALESAARSESTTANARNHSRSHSTNTRWCAAVASKMAWEAARVAATRGSSKAEGWAVSLYVSNTGARVALLRLGGAREWAAVRLVSRLLAVVAETLSGRALVCCVSDLATFVAGAAR
ncbi:hypothetical protein V494_05707 [Pseudogymnoascus sp. VKM F-4513 (FW-928)]|nr:hypothetical protein V494_05707 [Pseudogymnoascus sp. VKM F-4513 (FW-928)]